jgi:hypothetical protein
MSDPSPSSHFRGLFEAALQDYEKQTGTPLANHPLAEQLQECDSVDAINTVLQEQTRRFTDFRGDGKIMKSLKSTVSILYALSTNTALGARYWYGTSETPDGCPTCLMLILVILQLSTSKGDICRHCHPTRCMCLSLVLTSALL